VIYGKALFGVGYLNFPLNVAYGTYFDIALGGGLDYRLTRRIYLRAEYEYQIWPGFVGLPNPQLSPNHANSLTPNGFALGASYRIF
jgi:opacity protein-like surface antigen